MLINVKMTLHEIIRHVELCIFCLTKKIRIIPIRAEVKYNMQ